MRTLTYFPCKVCKIEGDKVYLPDAELDPQTGEILSVECKAFEEVDQKKLKKMKITSKDKFDHCEATIIENQQIMCFKCEDDYYYDGMHQECKEEKHHPTLQGCSLTFDGAHCVFCDTHMQMDVTTGSCAPKDKVIDLHKFDQEMAPGDNGQGEMSVNSSGVARDNYVVNSESFGDE